MAIDADILTILACPSADHAPLREEHRDDGDVLVCTWCATKYPIRDGIPVLLIDDATPGPAGIGRRADSSGAAPPAGPASTSAGPAGGRGPA